MANDSSDPAQTIADQIFRDLTNCMQAMILVRVSNDQLGNANVAATRSAAQNQYKNYQRELIGSIHAALDSIGRARPTHAAASGPSLLTTAAELKPHLIDVVRIMGSCEGLPKVGDEAAAFEKHWEQVLELRSRMHRQVFFDGGMSLTESIRSDRGVGDRASAGAANRPTQRAMTALRLLARLPVWRITRLPHGVDLDMLRLLDTDGFIKARPYQLYNPTTDPRKPLPMIAMPSEIGWVSPVGNPMLAGTWDTLSRQSNENERLACEICISDIGRAELARAGLRSLDSPAALLSELESSNPQVVIALVGGNGAAGNGKPPDDAFEDDVQRAWARALALRESNSLFPALPDPAAKFADRHVQLKNWCIEAMKVESSSQPVTDQNVIGTPEQIGFITQQVLDTFEFAYAHSGDNVALADEADIESFGRTRDDIPTKLRALQKIGESRGLDMSPLCDIGTRWQTLWRAYPKAADALRNLQSVIPENISIVAFQRTITRLRDQGQFASTPIGGDDLSPSKLTELSRDPGTPAAFEPLPLRDFHLTILAELNAKDVPVTAAQLSTLSGMPGYDHLLELMKELESWELVDRPHGRRSGYRILESARAELRRRDVI